MILALLLAGIKASRFLPPSPITARLQDFDQSVSVLAVRGFTAVRSRVEGESAFDAEGNRGNEGRIDFRFSPTRNRPVEPDSTLERPPAPPRSVWIARGGVVPVRTVAQGELDREGNRRLDYETGTGFVVWRDALEGLIVTSAHTLERGEAEVGLGPGGSFVPAEVLARDHSLDLALLRVGRRVLGDRPSLPLGAAGGSAAREPCWIVTAGAEQVLTGTSLGQPEELQRVLATRYGSLPFGGDWFALSQTTGQGFSGAPVIERAGRVIGVLVGGFERDGSPARSLAVGPESLRTFLLDQAPRAVS